ncbi:hypothetical protein HanIR_Chr15g0782711 [Helianthus annuus]|nr:hypothetical protein HanIR_Chr15g0782711 [Helianthus annuus]
MTMFGMCMNMHVILQRVVIIIIGNRGFPHHHEHCGQHSHKICQWKITPSRVAKTRVFQALISVRKHMNKTRG